MKRFYEIALMQHVHNSVENDYETVAYEYTSGYSYRQCKQRAKELSKHIGQAIIPNYRYGFPERKPKDNFPQLWLDEGLAAVKIVCYTENDTTTYEPLYYEYYNNGKVDYKIKFDS